MGFEDLAIVKALDAIADGINDNINNSILNGLAWLALIAILAYLVLYVWVWGALNGHLTRFFWILGILIVIELANLIGGGHNSR